MKRISKKCQKERKKEKLPREQAFVSTKLSQGWSLDICENVYVVKMPYAFMPESGLRLTLR